MTNWDDIKQEWQSTDITLTDLATKHNVKIGTLKSRKSREKWTRGVATNDKKVATFSDGVATKAGAPTGNKNAVGNTGGAPKRNQNAKGNKGGSAPVGNKNAVTTGEYESIMWDFLDDEERELYGFIETDPLYQIDRNVRELTIRQRRMMRRIKIIEDGLTEKQKRTLQQLRKVKEAAEADDKIVTVTKERMVTVEIEETSFRAIDDILSIEEALTRVTAQLVKASKQKYDIEKSNEEQSFRLEKYRLGNEKMQSEIAKIRAETKGNPNSQRTVDLSKLTQEELRALAARNK